MKILKDKAEKIMKICSWTHISEHEKMKKIESVLSETYDLGHCDGYAMGLRQGYTEGFEDGW